MRAKRRNNEQLKITSANRQRVHDFMRPFHATLMWCIDGPQDTSIDEIMCFVFYSRRSDEDGQFEHKGIALIQTWWERGESFALFTEQHTDARELIAAYNNEPEGQRIPVEGMTPNGFDDPDGKALSAYEEAHVFATGHMPLD